MALRLRRIKAGVYETQDGRFSIVRELNEWVDDELRHRSAWLWEIAEHRRYGWEVGHVGWPTTTLRESRQILADHLGT